MQLRRKLLVLAYALIACAPVAAMLLRLPDHRLDGSFPPAPPPALTFEGVRSEAFQSELTAWFESSLGFRAWETWIDNTALYHAFRETKYGSHVAIGDDRVLFERDDINFFNKSDAPPAGAIASLADDIAALQRRLAADHRALVPIFIPSKTTFYRDEVPARWTRDLGDPRPAQRAIVAVLQAELDRRGVIYVDGIDLLAHAAGPRERVWGRDARHFAAYAGCLCDAAILARYAELAGVQESPYPCETKEIVAKREHGDLDLFRLLNAWGAGRAPTAWEVVHPAADPAAPTPSAIWISSSFGWLMEFDAYSSHRFRDLRVDYYNTTLYEHGYASTHVEPHTPAWRAVFLTRDLYVLELNETYVTPGEFFGADAIHAILDELR